MKLAHPTLEEPISFDDGIINVLVVENAGQLSDYIYDIINQSKGSNGDFVLSDCNGVIPLDGVTDLILNPFSLNPNTREVTGAIFGLLNKRIMNEENYIENCSILAEIEKFALMILDEENILLKPTEGLRFINVLKAMGVKFTLSEDSLLESICDYLDVMGAYSKIKLFIFVNLKSYLSSEDMSALYRHINYAKHKALFIENRDNSSDVCERIVIIDEDLCEIRK